MPARKSPPLRAGVGSSKAANGKRPGQASPRLRLSPPTDAKRVLWRPATALTVGVAVDVRVNVAGFTAVLSDLAGGAMAASTRSFTPVP